MTSSSFSFHEGTAKKEAESYEWEEDYEELAKFWFHQGFLRTLVAPMDRVKFIMECQTELMRGRGSGDMNAGVGKHNCIGARGGQKGVVWRGSASLPFPVISGGCFVKAQRDGHRISSSKCSSSSFARPFAGSSSSSNGLCFPSSRFEGHSSPSFIRFTSLFYSKRKRREPQAPFSSSAVLVRHLSQHEGIQMGLWRGHSVQLISMAAQSLSYYHLSEPSLLLTEAVLSPQSEMSCLTAKYAPVLLAGFLCSLITYPLEFLRFHLALDVKGLFPGVSGGGASPISSSYSSFRESKGEICSRIHSRALAPVYTFDFLSPTTQRRSRGREGFFRQSLTFFTEWFRSPNRMWNYFRDYPVLRDSPSYYFTGLWLQMAGSMMYLVSYHLVMVGLDQCWWQRHSPPTYIASRSSASPYRSVLDNRSGLCTSPLRKVIDDVLATLIATTIAHPFDVVRRRRMLAVLRERTRYRDTLECVQMIAISDGVRGFFRGLPISTGRMLVMVGLLQGIGILEQEYFLRQRKYWI